MKPNAFLNRQRSESRDQRRQEQSWEKRGNQLSQEPEDET
jgi:hypothetical protein